MRALIASLLVAGVMTPVSSHGAAGPGQLDNVKDWVIDASHDVVFISGNRDGQGYVTVHDVDTTPVVDIRVNSPGEMALSADGAEIYVAQGDAHSIATIDTATYEVVTTTLASSYCPQDLAVVGGDLWMSSSCMRDPSLQVVDPASGSVLPVSHDLTFLRADWRLVATPALPDTVFVMQSNDYAQEVFALDVEVTAPVGGGDPTYTATTRDSVQVRPGPTTEATLSEDGSQLALVSGTSIDRYRTKDLSLLGRRQLAGSYPAGVAFRGDGWRVEAWNKNEQGIAQLLRPNGTVARTWKLSKGSGLDNIFGQIGFAGDQVLALQYRNFAWSLEALATKLPTTLRLTSPKYVGLGKSFTMTVQRSGSSARTVTITASPAGRPDEVVGRVHLNNKGRGRITVRAGRNTTFTASVAGDADHQAASATRRVSVAAPVQARIDGKHPVVGGSARFPARGTATLVAKVPHSQVGSCASILIQRRSHGSWRALATTDCIELPASRVIWTKFKAAPFGAVGQPLRMRGEFWGDSWYSVGHSRWVYLRFG